MGHALFQDSVSLQLGYLVLTTGAGVVAAAATPRLARADRQGAMDPGGSPELESRVSSERGRCRSVLVQEQAHPGLRILHVTRKNF